MATRSDIVVDYNPSPRIVEVIGISTELSVQDVVDTLRMREEAFTGMSHPKLLDASGKEQLGESQWTGVTASLRNAQLAFEPRRMPAEQGEVTTGSMGEIKGELTFSDSGADFVSAGVARGSLVINFTDHSIADVIRVENATTLTTRPLTNGQCNAYQVGDVYHVFNVVRCEIRDGNIVATDESEQMMAAVMPSAFTQVNQIASSNAAITSGGVLNEEQSTKLMGLPDDTLTKEQSAKLLGLPSVGEVVAELYSEQIDGMSFKDAMIDILARCRGKVVMVDAGANLEFYDQNDNLRFTYTRVGDMMEVT